MKFKHLLFAIPALLLTVACTTVPAHADAVITVTPWLAPNAYGSPSFPGAVSNAEYALEHGLSSYGAAGPTQFNAVTGPITTTQGIVTGFNSWMGVAEPGGTYSSELGNRMSFGLFINGNGSQFSISQLSFSAADDGTGDLDFGFNPGDYNYSSDYEGILKGADGILGTADDVFVTTGPNTQMVDGLVGRGSGNSFAAYCTGCTAAQEQQAIADAAAGPSYDYTGAYTLGASTGSATFVVSAVPEPSSLALLGTGLFGIVGAARRKFRV